MCLYQAVQYYITYFLPAYTLSAQGLSVLNIEFLSQFLVNCMYCNIHIEAQGYQLQVKINFSSASLSYISLVNSVWCLTGALMTLAPIEPSLPKWGHSLCLDHRAILAIQTLTKSFLVCRPMIFSFPQLQVSDMSRTLLSMPTAVSLT